MSIGSIVFVLHSHLPYCRKAGVWPFGEEWVFEAMAETYIPLLDIIQDLAGRNVLGGITIGFTPVLLDQLQDPYMLFRFDEYLEAKIAAAGADMARFQAESEGRLQELAEFHRNRYERVRKSFHDRYNRDIVGAFRSLQDGGHLQVLAGAATHAYLPLLSRDSSIYAQIRLGYDVYRQCFGTVPSGIWLPECGYRPPAASGNLDRALGELGIGHFFVDTHAIQGGVPSGIYSSRQIRQPEREARPRRREHTAYLPYRLTTSDIAVLGRNERTALQVWSSEWGYPGDGSYREFHRRDPVSGFHYWKVTSRLIDLSSKEVYDPGQAFTRAREHAGHFVELAEKLLLDFHRETGKHGVIVAPFDVELFGHWWLEGLDWFRWTLEGLASSGQVEVVTAADFLERHPPSRRIDLVESSWGLGGAHDIWDNDATCWMWQEIHSTEAEIERAAQEALREQTAPRRDFNMEVAILGEQEPSSDAATERLLRQAAREALLLQSSDWPFLIATEQAADYASRRFLEHRHRFRRLMDALKRKLASSETLRYLEEVEAIDAVFPQIDYGVFAGKQGFPPPC